MRFVDDEKDLYLVFSLCRLSLAFWVLAFGYVLSSGEFRAQAFLRSIPKFRTSCLAEVCTVMLRLAQNKPIHLMALWC